MPKQQTSPSMTPDQVLQQAVAQHRAGRLQDAERLYRAILQAQPGHPDANHNLGVLAVQVRQPAAGLPYFKAALEASPKQGQYWLSYVDALMQAGQADAARQALEQGRSRGLQGDAVEALARRLESGVAPAARDGHEQGKPGKRGPAPARKGAGAATGAQEVKALAALFAQGRYAEAETLARESTVRVPGNGVGWKALGTALKLQGRNAEALPPLQRAAALLPQDAETHYNLGLTLNELGRAAEAEASHRRAIQLRPDYAEAHYNLGIVLHGLVRVGEAEASYHRAIQIRPDYFEAHNNLGAILWNASRPEEAEAYCRRSLQLRPDYAEAHNNLGNILSSLGRLEEAAACYRKALEYKPGWALLYFNLHPLQLNAADMTPAIKSLAKAVELEPANDNYRFFLGMMLDYSGNPEAAAEHFGRLERSADLQRARLDAWRYIKSANGRLPITGSNIQAFRMGLGMAANEGLVLEFGVRFGASIRQIAALANQEVHGFDSFEGLPEQWHHEPKGMYSTKGVIPEVPDNVSLYAGWFEDTLPAFLQNHAGPVRFMNIDCDIYSSTKTVLDLLSDRIIPGTVIVFDEYIGNEHWREDEFKAFQEAVARYGWDYEYVCFSFFTKQVVVRIVRVRQEPGANGFYGDNGPPN